MQVKWKQQTLKTPIFSKDGRYTQFTMEDGEQAEYYFTMLMGDEC